MSRRCHHGSPRHALLGHAPLAHAPLARTPRRPMTTSPDNPPAVASAAPSAEPIAPAPTAPEPPAAPEPVEDRKHAVTADAIGATSPDTVHRPPEMAEPRPAARSPRAPAPPLPREPRATNGAPTSTGQPQNRPDGHDAVVERTTTAPQLRRFIKSRAYVPMHELRRRFLINGDDDEVTPVDLERTRVFVGLPEREGRLLGELLRAGDIGYELSLDPMSPIVVGVYPMRPVTRG
jgi:hypothetical protein